MAAALMGLGTAAIGIAIFVSAFAASRSSTPVLAVALLAAAMAQMGFAFVSKRAGNFFPKLFIAVFYLSAGIALFSFDRSTQTVVGVMLTLEAVFETVIATEVPAVLERNWYLFSAASSLLVGLVALDSPSNGWLVTAAVGFAIAVNGISRIVVSAMADHAAGESDDTREAEAELEPIFGDKLVRARFRIVAEDAGETVKPRKGAEAITASAARSRS